MKRTFFEANMDTTPDSVVYSDLEGHYLKVSKSKAERWGLTRRQMIGKTDFDFMPEEEALEARKYSVQVIETGQPIECEQKVVRNGDVVWYSLSEVPLCDEEGTIIGTISTSRNITTRVLQEQKNLEMSKQILDMVKIVSHDLSSPLINISVIAKLIIRGNFGEINDEVAKATNDIYRRILKLRGDVLDYLHKFSNLSEGQEVEKEVVDLRKDVIDEVLEELDECIKDNNSIVDSMLGLIPVGAVVILSCKVQLKIVYRNLIMNALKYGGDGCIISFGFEDKVDKYFLNVFNNGPAILEEYEPLLFEPFTQGGNAQKGISLGLGLPTIRNMIRNLGGDLWYKTTSSQHPNFIFTVLKSDINKIQGV